MKEELTKLMTDSYDQGVKDALESIKEGLDALPKREWVGLTDEDIHNTAGYSETREMYKFALALIAKLKEKNA